MLPRAEMVALHPNTIGRIANDDCTHVCYSNVERAQLELHVKESIGCDSSTQPLMMMTMMII